MVATNEYKNDTKAYRIMYVSIFLFVFVIASTIGLYFYNEGLKTDISAKESEISKTEDKIKKINENEKIKLYILYKSNLEFIKKYSYLSDIPKFIDTFKEVVKTYKLEIEGFSYSNGEITTQASVSSDSYGFAFKKLKDFLSFFRNKNEHIFSLGFIGTFNGQDNINFGINFKIK